MRNVGASIGFLGLLAVLAIGLAYVLSSFISMTAAAASVVVALILMYFMLKF